MNQEDLKKIIAEELQAMRSSTPVVEEQEVLEEVLGIGAILGKLFLVLTQRENIRKVIRALMSNKGDLPEGLLEILQKIEELLDLVETNLPKIIKRITDARASSPRNRVVALLVNVFSDFIKQGEPDEPHPNFEQGEGEYSPPNRN